MIDFIAEYVWVFVIVGIIIILVAIGYVVDKFVINKIPSPKKDVIQPLQNIQPTPVKSINDNPINEIPSTNVKPDIPVQPMENFTENDNSIGKIPSTDVIPNVPVQPMENFTENDNSIGEIPSTDVIPNVPVQPLENFTEEDSVVVTEPLFDSENVNMQSVNIDTENNGESVWKV